MKGSVKLNSLNEKSIADAYEALFATDYKPLVAELQTLRGNGLNNDWATFLFIKRPVGKIRRSQRKQSAAPVSAQPTRI